MSASTDRSSDVATRAKGAAAVVVGVVTDVDPRLDVNQFGDRLIVSQVWVSVEESLKGSSSPLLSVDIEGGTIGDLQLRVSDMPTLRKGERGVFFLDSTASGVYRPHDRGFGVLKLDASGRVQGSGASLAEVKAKVLSTLR
jgi:hypothetical protein